MAESRFKGPQGKSRFKGPEVKPAYWDSSRQGMDTLTMEASTKGSAAVGALVDAAIGAASGDGFNYSDAYDQNLAALRAAKARYEEEHPYRAAAGDVGGLAIGIAKLPMIGRGVFGVLKTGAAYGAGGGALEDADSMWERISNAIWGAGTGAAITGTAYGGGKAIGYGLDKAGKAIKNMRLPPDIRAAGEIADIADTRFGPNAAHVMDREIAKYGPEAVRADVLGEQGRAAARQAANVSPVAREQIETFAAARKGNQNVRLAGDVQKAGGVEQGSRKTVEELQKEAYDKVRPEINAAYTAMREAGYDLPTAPFDDILSTPMGRAAKAQALKSVRNRYFDEPSRDLGGVSPAAAKAVSPASVANRAVKTMTAPLGPRPAKPADLLDYVRGKGGVADFKGELRALDAKQVKGLVKETGMSLDQMRELAAREGYLDYKFGTADRAVAESTVGDFLDALDDNLRGRPVFAAADVFEADRWLGFKDAQAGRAEIWEAAKRIADEAGGRSINDDVLKNAVQRVIERGDDPAAALEAAAFADFVQFGAEPQAVPGGIFEKVSRNYSNAAYLDEIKRALDDVTGGAKRAGLNNKADQASNLSKALRRRMDDLMQGNEYAAARGLREQAYKAEEAFKLGEELGQRNVPMNLPKAVAKVEPQNAPNVAAAYAQTKAQRLLNNANTEGALTEFVTPMGRDASKAALGDKGVKVLDQAVEREKLFNLLNKALGNSTTARQLAEIGGAGLTGGAIGGYLSDYDPATMTIMGVLSALARKTGPKMAQRMTSAAQQKTAPELAKLLTSRGLLPEGRVPPKNVLEKLSKTDAEALVKGLLLELQKTNPQTNRAQ